MTRGAGDAARALLEAARELGRVLEEGSFEELPRVLELRRSAFEALRPHLEAAAQGGGRAPAELEPFVREVLERDAESLRRAEAGLAEVEGELAAIRRTREAFRALGARPVEAPRFVSRRA